MKSLGWRDEEIKFCSLASPSYIYTRDCVSHSSPHIIKGPCHFGTMALLAIPVTVFLEPE